MIVVGGEMGPERQVASWAVRGDDHVSARRCGMRVFLPHKIHASCEGDSALAAFAYFAQE